ncbi:DUF2917 domain-containing protein [Polaromonas sp. LjRoot131]|uniref:DUF2917 domain-containing protein n=1 Tax=Polaromonas sp. LjRoot131 TaxID=3342262 RepID=UPI003ED0BD4B
MMNAKPKSAVLHGATRHLVPGQALRLPRRGGELTVLRGRLWLTRHNDPGDHFIDAGQRLHLADHENAVIEPAGSAQGVILRWEPRCASFTGALLARPLSATAFVALMAARGFAALARKAAAGARRARGHDGINDGHAVFVALEGGAGAEPARLKRPSAGRASACA